MLRLAGQVVALAGEAEQVVERAMRYNLLLDQKDLLVEAEEEVEVVLLGAEPASSVVRKVICQESVLPEAVVEEAIEPALSAPKRVTSLETVLMAEEANLEVQ
jgi:hypothetical protein